MQVFGSLALFEYSLSGSFVLSCVLFAIHAFLCGSSIKIGCCKLGPLWPCLSPPAPTLIHRCSSIIHTPAALLAWVVILGILQKTKNEVSFSLSIRFRARPNSTFNWCISFQKCCYFDDFGQKYSKFAND